MRIALVSEHADPTAALGGADAGGQNVHVAALARALAGRGHLVTVYTRLASPDAEREVHLAAGARVRRLPAGPAAALAKDDLLPHMAEFGDQLGREWRRRPPDVVHAHFWMSGLASLRGAAGLGVPVTQTFHALGSVKAYYQGARDTSPPGRIAAERQLGQECAQIIATCRDEVDELGRLGVPRGTVSVVPCGVDTTSFRPGGAALRRGPGGRLLVLGRLVARKGIDTAIDAVALLPGTELVVAGGPDRAALPEDPEYRRLRGIAHRRGVANRVFFTGAVPRPRVPELIRCVDLVVCTPWYEPFGITPLEAMACGVPVVASAVGGLTDSVVHGSTGLLVPPRDAGMTAAAAATLLADSAMRAAFGRAGVRRARRWYSWPRVAAQTENVYARLGAGAPAAAAAADSGDAAGGSLAVGAP
jgi:D-inositol-3-phosphate glycosyltransferase